MKTLEFLPHNFAAIAAHLKEGLPAIFPTETCYGFSGDIFSQSAIIAVEKIKKRNNKPFLLLVSNFAEMSAYAEIKESSQEKILSLSSEEPTSFLFPKTKKLPSFYFPEFSEIGVRISHYKPLLGFLHFYKNPLFSTSANVSGFPEIYNSDEIVSTFGNIPGLLFVDAGNLKHNNPSRLLRIDNAGEIEILRK